MHQQSNNSQKPIRPNLKHDNMQYAASTEGDDILDQDKESIQEIEEEEITAEELVMLQEDDVDSQAAALNSAEIDSQADEDNFLNEKTTEEEYEGDAKEEEEENERR